MAKTEVQSAPRSPGEWETPRVEWRKRDWRKQTSFISRGSQSLAECCCFCKPGNGARRSASLTVTMEGVAKWMTRMSSAKSFTGVGEWRFSTSIIIIIIIMVRVHLTHRLSESERASERERERDRQRERERERQTDRQTEETETQRETETERLFPVFVIRYFLSSVLFLFVA